MASTRSRPDLAPEGRTNSRTTLARLAIAGPGGPDRASQRDRARRLGPHLRASREGPAPSASICSRVKPSNLCAAGLASIVRPLRSWYTTPCVMASTQCGDLLAVRARLSRPERVRASVVWKPTDSRRRKYLRRGCGCLKYVERTPSTLPERPKSGVDCKARIPAASISRVQACSRTRDSGRGPPRSDAPPVPSPCRSCFSWRKTRSRTRRSRLEAAVRHHLEIARLRIYELNRPCRRPS